MSLQNQQHQDRRIAYLRELGCTKVYRWEHTQSGYESYSLYEPDNHHDREMNRVTAVPLEQVPAWAIRQIEM